MRRKRGLLSWVWSLTRVSLVIFLIWIWLRYQDERDSVSTGPIELKSEGPPQKPPSDKPAVPGRSAGPEMPVKPDDLTRIKGIGPKAANAFQQAGISSYQQLASAGLQEIQEILEKANYRLLDPTTWIEQARLAAEGRWEELQKLQATMRTDR